MSHYEGNYKHTRRWHIFTARSPLPLSPALALNPPLARPLTPDRRTCRASCGPEENLMFPLCGHRRGWFHPLAPAQQANFGLDQRETDKRVLMETRAFQIK